MFINVPYRLVLSSLFVVLLMWACRKDSKRFVSFNKHNDEFDLELPPGFPALPVPEDNKLSKSRVFLGRKLFFDPILSRDSSVSCASCHLPAKAFTDGKVLSIGIEGRVGMRNAPTLANLAYATHLMFDGGIPTLELQVLAPLADHNEMDIDINELVERLRKDKYYVALFQQAYMRPPDAFGITRAIAAYERTLISGNSRYDKFAHGIDTTCLTESEKKGMALFFSPQLACVSCHGGFTFTNNQFENNGLYLQYADTGRARITMQASDVGKFKVPTLRNINETAPYMHDGSLPDLFAVIEHYASGGKNHPNKSAHIQGFSITPQEKTDLVHFLQSLSDEKFLNNPNFIP